MDKKVFTVYMHVAPNMKKYIGMTCQKPKRRWENGDGYKNQKLFYRAINKYGWENIEHVIIADKLTKKEACKLEIDMIKYWNTTDRDEGYNILTGGGTGTLGISPSQEIREKIRIGNLGKVVSEDTKNKQRLSKLGKKQSYRHLIKKNKPVLQYGIDGKFIKEFDSAKTASEFYGYSASSIGKSCREEIVQYKGYIWVFKGNDERDISYRIYNIKNKLFKPILQFDLGMNFIKEWDSATTAGEVLGLTRNNIYRCCRGDITTSCGFIWEYKK